MARSRLGPDAPAFVGRERELAVLRGALQRRPALVVVSGPAGIGKTSLVQRFLAGGPRALWASGDESETLVSFGVADQMLRRGGGTLPAGDHVAVGLELLALLAGDDAAGVMVVDDAHWADEPSLRALLFAARRLVAEPLLVVLVTRDDALLPDGLRKLAALRLEIGPLSADELGALAAAIARPLSAGAARRLSEHTGGHPLYARALLESETELDGVRVLPVPRSYGEVVAARLRGCPAPARALVEAASVLGLYSGVGLVAGVAGLAEPLPALDEAIAAGLLVWAERDDGRSIAFPHPLTRAAVYHGLPAARRTALHAAAAGLVEDGGAALRHRIEATPATDESLAREAEAFAGREVERGAWASAVATLRAASRLSPTRAERERRMLDAIDAMLYAGDGAGARRLAAETPSFADTARKDAVLAYLAIYAGNADEAQTRLEHAWAALPPAARAAAGEPAEPAVDSAAARELAATIAQRRAFVASQRFRAPEVAEWSRRALVLAPGQEKTQSLAATQLSVALSLLGRRGEAHATLDAAIARTGTSGFPLRSVKGALLLGDDDLAGARPVLSAAAADAQRIGSLVIAAQSLALLAKLEFACGGWDEAVVLAERGVSLAAESDEVWVRAFTHWALLHVPLARGEATVAPSVSGSAFERIVEVEACAVAERAAAREDPAAVLRALAPVAAGPVGFWRWQPLYADALIESERLSEAEAFLDEQHGRWSASVEARLARSRGRMEVARGRAREAEAAFADALARLAPLNMPYELALTELAYGQFLRRGRRRREATTALAAARERLAPLGARPALERCERELAACGLSPAKRGGQDASSLTPQERAVAQLVASGLSNRRVADELLVSVRTVEAHLTRIYGKVGVGSRAELAARFRDV